MKREDGVTPVEGKRKKYRENREKVKSLFQRGGDICVSYQKKEQKTEDGKRKGGKYP